MGGVDELERAILDDFHQVKRVLVDGHKDIWVVAHIRLVVLVVNDQLAVGHHLLEPFQLHFPTHMLSQLLEEGLDCDVSLHNNGDQNAL